jgi:hypothetical protein
MPTVIDIAHRLHNYKRACMLLPLQIDSWTVRICDFGLARLKAFTQSMTNNCGTVQVCLLWIAMPAAALATKHD